MERKGWIFAIVSGIVLLIAVVWIFKIAFPSLNDDSMRLSEIVLSGLALTVILMTILVIVYQVLGINNPTQLSDYLRAPYEHCSPSVWY